MVAPLLQWHTSACATVKSLPPRRSRTSVSFSARRSQETEAAYTSRGFGDLWQATGEARRNGTLPHNPHAPSQAVGEFIVRAEAARGRA